MRTISASFTPNFFCKFVTVIKPPYPAPNTKIVGLFTKIETTFYIIYLLCRERLANVVRNKLLLLIISFLDGYFNTLYEFLVSKLPFRELFTNFWSTNFFICTERRSTATRCNRIRIINRKSTAHERLFKVYNRPF